MRSQDTIALQATPYGQGGIHVVWVVGEKAAEIVQALFPGKNLYAQPQGSLLYGSLKAKSGEKIDEVLIRKISNQESIAGENTVEISLHGSQFAVARLLEELEAAGASRASREDFFQSAGERKTLDRCRREAWDCLLRATTPEAAAAFSRMAQGALSQKLQDLLGSKAGDVPQRRKIGDLLATAQFGLALAQPLRIAILGPTNAGKSTLFNALLGYERVLVAQVQGTTRDPIREIGSIEGYPILWIDTAGFRETEDSLELLGIAESKREWELADGVVWVFDGSRKLEDRYKSLLLSSGEKLCTIFRNKSDLGTCRQVLGDPFLSVEGSLHHGAPAAVRAVGRKILERRGLPTPISQEAPFLFTPRQIELLRESLKAIEAGKSVRDFLRSLLWG